MGRVILAVPSKGRLKDQTAAFFARAGLDFKQGGGGRDYTAAIPSLPGVEVLFLSAAEIADKVAAGGAHLGVTGEDLIREQIADADQRVAKIAGLGFGHANVVVAAPQSWIDVASMIDIEDVAADFRDRRQRKLRVATKYVNLTRRFFAEHGVADYRIVESQGATEGAPSSGAAELIVDITSSGATLAANGLKVVDDGVILRSQACLFASLGARWDAEALRLRQDAAGAHRGGGSGAARRRIARLFQWAADHRSRSRAAGIWRVEAARLRRRARTGRSRSNAPPTRPRRWPNG